MFKKRKDAQSDIRIAAFLPALVFATTVLSNVPWPSAKAAERPQSAELTLQLGHIMRVNGATFSPDGKTMLTGSDDGIARLWEIHSGRELRRLEQNNAPLKIVAFNRGGSEILTADADAIIRRWSTVAGKMLSSVTLPRGGTPCAFSPDGLFVLTCSRQSEGGLRIWETASGRELRRYKVDTKGILAAAFSRDGRRVISSGEDGNARFWDVASGRQLGSFHNTAAEITSIAFSPDGNHALIGTSDNVARLLDARTYRELRVITGHSGPVDGVAFSNDGRSALTASRDKTACLWDVATGLNLRCFSHRGSVSFVEMFPSGRAIISGGYDTTRIWEIANGRELKGLEGGALPASWLRILPDENTILTGAGSELRQWNLKTGRETQRIQLGSTTLPHSLTALSPDGRFAVTGSDDGLYRLWESAGAREMQSLPGYSREVADVALSLDGRQLLIGEFNGSVRLGDFSTGQALRRIAEFDVGISSPAFSPDGRFALTVSGDSTCLLDTGDGHRVYCLGSLKSSVSSTVFSPDGHFILTGTTFGTAELWEKTSGKHVRQFAGHSAPVDAVAFSPDGRFILTGSQDSSARLWDRDSGREVQLFKGHPFISRVAIFSDLSNVVTVGADKTVRFWNVSTGQELVRLVSFTGGAWAVIAPDGKFDSSWLEQMRGLNWQMPDDPLRVMPFEIFQRDYYEPRLLPRLLACNRLGDCQREFRPLRPLVDLNRVQPEVKITKVRRGSSPDVALVDVAVGAVEDLTQKNRRTSTAVYDLRLYRDGQLVGQWPKPTKDVAVGTAPSDELGAWRSASRVPIPAGRSKAVRTFKVHLAARDRGNPTTFTAYAFNDDRVKSETASYEKYVVPGDIAAQAPRAYVVTIGVNAYQNERRDLGFAVRDAQELAASLRRIRDYDVVPVTLLAASKRIASGERVVTVDQATKAHIRAVLEVLAGKPGADRQRLRAVPGADRLTHARPDDLVVMSFSGHGYSAPGGRFYLLPSDSGLEDDFTDTVARKYISSEELSYWLREMDVGQMTLIIDACHSAASVEGQGFKPGPMGDRGLGQLAYDKGMSILVASQADDVALESKRLGHGLLTYALVHDGFGPSSANPAVRAADSNGNGEVEMAEWLQYGENRVPQLYDEILAGKVRALRRNSSGEVALVIRDPRVDPDFTSWFEKRRAQTPALFNYQRNNRSAVINAQ